MEFIKDNLAATILSNFHKGVAYYLPQKFKKLDQAPLLTKWNTF
jgi:hypothetical protein